MMPRPRRTPGFLSNREVLFSKETLLEWLKRKLRRNLNYSARDLAAELGVSRATLFNYFEKYGISLKEIKRELEEEKKQLALKEHQKRELKALPPKDWKDFINRSIVKELKDRLNNANITEGQRKVILSTFYDVCITMKLPPEFFIEKNAKDIKKLIEKYLSIKIEAGYDRNDIIRRLQALQKYLDFNILPSYVEQARYQGKYNNAYLNIKVRSMLVEEIIKDYKYGNQFVRELAEKTLRAIVFLFWTGSRSEALTNFTVMSKIKATNNQIVRLYGEEEFLVVQTKEKGKKAQKITWNKIIPIKWVNLIPPRRLGPKEIDEIRDYMKEKLRKLYEKYKNKTIKLNGIEEPYFNDDTIGFLNLTGELRTVDGRRKESRILHIWRHTAAHEFLRASRFNHFIVGKLLGWKYLDNLKIYSDPDIFQILSSSEDVKTVKFLEEETEKKLLSLFNH